MPARGNESRADLAHDELRRAAISDLDVVIQALTDLRGDLRRYQTGVERMRRKLLGGGPLSATPRLGVVAEARTRLSGRLDDVERARSESRRSLWRLQLAEGLTLSEIARFWGFSRQLVSRTLSAAGVATNGASRAKFRA